MFRFSLVIGQLISRGRPCSAQDAFHHASSVLQSSSPRQLSRLPPPISISISISVSICHPQQDSVSWALPCPTHVAVSLMKLVLQQPPSTPSCTKGFNGIPRLPGHLFSVLRFTYRATTLQSRLINAIVLILARPDLCTLSLQLRLTPQLGVAPPGDSMPGAVNHSPAPGG